MTTSPKMQHVSQSDLNTSLESRLTYDHAFLNFDASDGAAIQASAPLLQPLVPTLLDGIYTKLLQYDVTAAAFVPKLGHELDAAAEPRSAHELNLEHPHIKRQMSFLRAYVLRIATNRDWTAQSPLWLYMDHVALMHTGSPGFRHRERRPQLRVEFMHMALLLGFLEDMIVGAVADMADVDLATKVAVLRAWNKVLWIQNDLFAKYYVKDVDDIRKDHASGPAGPSALGGVTRDFVSALIGGIVALLAVSSWR